MLGDGYPDGPAELVLAARRTTSVAAAAREECMRAAVATGDGDLAGDASDHSRGKQGRGAIGAPLSRSRKYGLGQQVLPAGAIA